MPIIETTSLENAGVEVFTSLTEAQLRNRIDPTKGIFIAESPKVINVALNAGYEPISMLCDRKHITGNAADYVARIPMSHDVDSLNVAAAAAVAFWQLRAR